MLPTNVLFYGTEAPLPEQTPLRAGPLTLVYEAGDLRYLRFGEHEVLRRIYAAVRDHNWGTVPGLRADERIEAGPDWFRISYRMLHQQGTIDFSWTATITGETDGTIHFTFDGLAQTSFQRNRIGLCVLHPAACAGARATVEQVDGAVIETRLPELVTPDQPPPPFTNMRALEHAVAPGVTARLEFAGDAFELEDQRNWTDASFKTFSTPLRLPFPVEVAQGTRVRQVATLSVTLYAEGIPGVAGYAERGTLNTGQQGAAYHNDKVFIIQRSAFSLPSLGLVSNDNSLSPNEVRRLQGLNLSHLRADLDLTKPGSQVALARATAESRALGLPLELALLLSDEPEVELRQFRMALDREQPPIASWLIYATNERLRGGTPIARLVAAAHAHLAGYGDAPFAAGTNADYIFAARNPPPVASLDHVCTAINPQVHAFDLRSVTETLAAQGVLARSGRATFGLPVAVSPVTFMPRSNPYATAAPPPLAPGELPASVDVRQMSLYGAGWTLGSIKYLAEAGAASVTYYETTGWRGVMETAHGSPLPEQFRSLPGAVFPLYHALADVGEFRGGQVRESVSSAPLCFDGLTLHKEGRARLLLASFLATTQHVTVHGVAGAVRMRMLHAGNAIAAMREPEAFRNQPGELREARDGTLLVELPPFAVVRLDWQETDTHGV